MICCFIDGTVINKVFRGGDEDWSKAEIVEAPTVDDKLILDPIGKLMEEHMSSEALVTFFNAKILGQISFGPDLTAHQGKRRYVPWTKVDPVMY